MARHKRPAIRVLFTASPEYASDADGLGEFLPAPVHVDDLVEVAERLLRSPSENQT
jgi:hypothetical protein